MTQDTLEFDLRNARPDDLEELVQLRIAAMRESLERVGRFNPQRARDRLLKDFAPENTRCIVARGAIIGFVIVALHNEELVLKHLYIHPEFQDAGVGTSILRDIIEQGKTQRRDIRLITLKQSRANGFYLRNGFRQIDSTEFDNVYLLKYRDDSTKKSQAEK